MKKLRLLLFEECNRKCRGCCNNGWDLKKIPIVKHYKGYELIMFTGGEPLLYPEIVKNTIKKIRVETQTPIIIYTATTRNIKVFKEILKLVEGVTLTLHTQKDVFFFKELLKRLSKEEVQNKSIRLNVFKNVYVPNVPKYWIIKRGMRWIKDCSLPHNEEFKRLPLNILTNNIKGV